MNVYENCLECLICRTTTPEATGLDKTRHARVFSDPQATPAEAELRRLKGIVDALLLKVMQESVEDDSDQARLAWRVERARARLEALDCLTPEQRCRLAAYAVYEHRLEKATEITDRLLMQGVRSLDLYLVAALGQLSDRRFQEARDMLMSARDLARCAHIDQIKAALDAIVEEQVNQTPYSDGATHAKRTYVLADQHNDSLETQLDEALRRLRSGEDVLVVQDRMDAYDFTTRYGDRILSMETEHRVWQTTEGPHRNIRTVFKNDNHGNHVKALKMGVRKALGAGAQEVLTNVSGAWSNTIAELVKQADGTDPDSRTDALARLDAYTPTKRIALLGVTMADFCQGVPIVMRNIARGLSESFSFSYITNDFDTNQIKYFDETGLVGDFDDRAAFARFVHKNGIKFDVLHFHSWHYSDHYKPFHSERDKLDVGRWLEQLNSPKFIYTDHSNPTEDLRRIEVHHDIEYASLSDDDKAAFLRSHNLRSFSVEHWERGWDATSILCRRQMMQLADQVTHVSATQRSEEDQLILPHYDVNGKHVVVWNGTDLLAYRNIPHVRERGEELKWSRNGKFILYVGRATKEKGIFDLAAAAMRLRALGSPINLVYVGNFEHSLRRALDRISNQQNLYTGRIHDRAELAAQYMAADLVAQPTWGECFNQVVSEGLAMGTASVVSNISGPKEVYVSNGIAFSHQPQAPVSLAQEIRRGLTDDGLRGDIIARGQQFVEQRLSVQSMAAQYAGIYRA